MTHSIPELIEALRQDAQAPLDPARVFAAAMRRGKARRTRRRFSVAVAAALATALVAAIPLVITRGGQPIGPQPPASPIVSTTAPVEPDAAAPQGTLFYIASDSPYALTAWSPQDAQPRTLFTFADAGGLVTGTISPDGTRIAWVQQQVLNVANADGSGRRELLDDVEDACTEPTWLPDGQHVTVRRLSGSGITTGYVDVSDGAYHPFAVQVQGCHILWTADGKTMAFAGDGGQIMIAASDGTGARAVPDLGEVGGNRRSYDPMSLSGDGRLLTLRVRTGDMPAGDAARDLLANEIVDTTTGQTRTLPLEGELVQAYFVPTGGLVARVRSGSTTEVVLLSSELKVLSRTQEPASLANSALVSYAPAT